jgi:hypothetical protein
VAVHERHLEFVLEIGDRPEAAHDRPGANLLHELHQQARKALDPENAVATHQLADHLHPLLHREERILVLVVQHGDDDFVEHRAAALDDVEVTVVDRIEGARIDRHTTAHRFTSDVRSKVS